MRIPVSVLLVLATGALLSSGCGDKRSGAVQNTSSISGTVTYKGEAVTGGVMVFVGKDKGFPAALGPDGKYTCSLQPGDYIVTIDTRSLKDADPTIMMRKMGSRFEGRPDESKTTAEKDFAMMKEKSKGGMGKYVSIPEKYADPKSSGLSVKVELGSNTKEIQLTD